MYQDLKNVCGDDCVESCTSLYMFQEGRESLEDDPKSRLTSVCSVQGKCGENSCHCDAGHANNH